MGELTFDLTIFTARQMGTFIQATQTSDIEAISAILASGVVTACPKEWGPPNEVDTFANLPYWGEFQEVITGLAEAGNKITKN